MHSVRPLMTAHYNLLLKNGVFQEQATLIEAPRRYLKEHSLPFYDDEIASYFRRTDLAWSQANAHPFAWGYDLRMGKEVHTRLPDAIVGTAALNKCREALPAFSMQQ